MAVEDTERVSVSTYVPAYQCATWGAEAEAMDVSRSEYVRLMVQAGRRSFDLDSADDGSEASAEDSSAGAGRGTSPGHDARNPVNGHESTSTPRANGLEDRILDLLRDGDHLSWEELVAGLTDDIEERLDDALGELQDENRVRYSGRHGGYTVVADE